jgi:tRNA-2-methylthio-N6-dimethylallyladenosine synthase
MAVHPSLSVFPRDETSRAGRGRRVWMASFGCQMNLLDSELVLGDLVRRGYASAERMEDADVVLVNTCSIRDHAEEKVWSLLGRARKLKEERPGVLVGVLGCMAQRAKDEIVRRAPHVDLVLGTSSFRSAVDDLEDVAEAGGRVLRTPRRPEGERLPDADRNVTVRPQRHRAFVTVMRGCDHVCAYCIVPFTRGREVSRPLGEVLEETRRLVDDGVREITFLGQNINTYGKDLGEGGLPGLLEAASEVPGLDRIRFLTSNPFDMDEGMMRRFGALAKVMPWLHIPAQSGSDRVLRAMKRTYTVERYREVVAWARAHLPGVEITSDFIVGFPGETDEDFEETLRLVEETGFVQCYVFKYSVRPRTLAARRLPDDVPEAVKQARNVRLLELQDRIALERNRRLLGRRVEVLVDGPSRLRPEMLTGREPGNRIVHCPGDASLAGRLAVVRIEDAGLHSLVGTLEAVEGEGRWPTV